ncbi:cupin domain-containing protein [Nocardioides cheoyonin]|uniref:cupin domain-containing protein n=1 Tax=Nocardioides cheoyonin TaxID=3156615 RepID=UPI0032B34B75
MSDRYVDARVVRLDDLPLEDGRVLAGSPSAGIRPFDTLTGVEVGVWSLSEGAVTDTEADEVFVVVAGRGTVAFDGGEEVALEPGVVVRLHAGERTTWTVTETLRKVYVAP